ncbi:MAG: SUMF1/EgtB/PvdO family nonheme iron enzyme [Planctomycetes bacterium]|nr:SUMF1/EgtB/PvdO family nonheme iron enzyme [Planctomycetota bacterium]
MTSDAWDPHHPTLAKGLFASRWPAEGSALFTLVSRAGPIRDAPLLEVDAGPDAVLYDLWRGERLDVEPRGGRARVAGSVDGLGAIAVVGGAAPAGLEDLLAFARREAAEDPPAADPRAAARSVAEPAPVGRTRPVPSSRPPPGMVLVPGGKVRLALEHMRRECGCYPDPLTPPAKERAFLWGAPHDGVVSHDYAADVRPFFIDLAEVSNEEYARFIQASGYRPRFAERFLAHWPEGRLLRELADHPVVFVDLDDARAYARWAGKRLPTEPEWHLAAQGTDGRAWPWGSRFNAARCNASGSGTMPVRSLPEGRSPWGCFHMSGNVWEWTESARDDGHTRFAVLRGGSWFDARGSIWYVRGGPQPCTSHAKLLLLWPGLDRSATIGFRCVVDAGE